MNERVKEVISRQTGFKFVSPGEVSQLPKDISVNVLYYRHSTDDQGKEGFSPETQVNQILEWMQGREWNKHPVVVLGDEGYSGSLGWKEPDKNGRKLKYRPDFTILHELLNNGRVACIIATALDRLARNEYFIQGLLRDCTIFGTSIHCRNDGENMQDRHIEAGVMGIVAGQYLRDNSKKIQASLDERTKVGLPPGKVPYGWKNSTRTDDEVRRGIRPGVKPVEEEKEIVLLIRDMFLSGLSLGQIATKLNAMDIKSPNGKRWYKEPLRDLLLNPFHAGYFRKKGKVIEGQHIKDAFWTIEDRHELESIYRTRKKHNKPFEVSSNHLLGGLITCGICGRPIRFGSESRQKNGPAYYCDQGCRGVRAPVKLVDRYAEDKIRELCGLEPTLEMACEEAEVIIASKYSDPADMMKTLEVRESELQKKLERAFDAYIDGNVSDEVYLAKKSELESDLAAVEDELGVYRGRQSEVVDLIKQLERVVESVKEFDSIWEELTREERREVMRLVFEQLILTCENGHAKLLVKTYFMPPQEYAIPSYKYAASWDFGPYAGVKLTWVQCAKLRLEGVTYAEIAEKRRLDVRSVRTYLSALTGATEARNLSEALEKIRPYIDAIDSELLDRPVHGSARMNLNRLTEKELGALRARLAGGNGDQAARILGVSRTCFNSRLAHAYHKLGTNKFDEAVKAARERGYEI